MAGGTLLANCDLSTVIGLESMMHGAPSTVSLDTIARSGGRIPRLFLLGAGVAEPLIDAQATLSGVRRTYPTVLLVGSLEDSGLAEKLCRGLSEAHIPAWALYPDDESALNSGEASLDHTVYYDRLVLLCTDAALENPLTSRYFAELVRSAGHGALGEMVSLGAGEAFYRREDRLCRSLRDGTVLDLRHCTDAKERQRAFDALVRHLSAPVF